MPILTDPVSKPPDMKTPGAFRYPSLGDQKPLPSTKVMLIRADGSHGVGEWTDDCKAWAPRTAADRRRDAKKGKA